MKIELKDSEFFTLNDFSHHEVIREIAAVVLSGSDDDKEIILERLDNEWKMVIYGIKINVELTFHTTAS